MRRPFHRPKQIEFVEQRKKTDCGIAVAAMLSGKLYGDIVAFLQALEINSSRGISLDEMFELLEELGFFCKEYFELPKNGKTLITIKWKEQNLTGHYVVWDGKRNQFLDPLHGLINKREMLKFANIESIWKVIKYKVVKK